MSRRLPLMLLVPLAMAACHAVAPPPNADDVTNADMTNADVVDTSPDGMSAPDADDVAENGVAR